ncbi:MAG: hypothetical protein IJE99_06375 [Alistipes sp.]|nr:hypothetical protein [Alistipes sp.]
MKRLFTLCVALLSIATLSAQQPYKVYCTLSALHHPTTFGTLSRVEIDYGQRDQRKNYLVDSYGKAISGQTTTSVANQLAKHGWTLEESYVVGEDNIRCVWIMSKMVTSEEQITEGIMTRWLYENCGPHPIN